MPVSAKLLPLPSPCKDRWDGSRDGHVVGELLGNLLPRHLIQSPIERGNDLRWRLSANGRKITSAALSAQKGHP